MQAKPIAETSRPLSPSTRFCIAHPRAIRWRTDVVSALLDPELRRRSHGNLNKGESRHALARAVFFHRLGELRDRTAEAMAYRASGLNLVVNAIILWNTTYLSRAVAYARGQGITLTDDAISHVARVKWDHIALTGDYL